MWRQLHQQRLLHWQVQQHSDNLDTPEIYPTPVSDLSIRDNPPMPTNNVNLAPPVNFVDGEPGCSWMLNSSVPTKGYPHFSITCPEDLIPLPKGNEKCLEKKWKTAVFIASKSELEERIKILKETKDVNIQRKKK